MSNDKFYKILIWYLAFQIINMQCFPLPTPDITCSTLVCLVYDGTVTIREEVGEWWQQVMMKNTTGYSKIEILQRFRRTTYAHYVNKRLKKGRNDITYLTWS